MQFGGVIGMFNCQGAGWYPEEQKCKAHPECYKTISGSLSPDDVEWEQKDFTAKFRKNQLFTVYLHKAADLHLMKGCDKMDITIQPSSFEIVTISPVYEFGDKAKFAAVGLENMFNSGGAVELLEQELGDEKSVGALMKIKGAGKFLAYSSIRPMQVLLNGECVKFEWKCDGVLKFEVPWVGGELTDARILICD